MMIDCLGVEITKGNKLDYLDSGYTWNHINSKDILAFDREESGYYKYLDK